MTAPANDPPDPDATRLPPDPVPPSPPPAAADQTDFRLPPGTADAANDPATPAVDPDQTNYTADAAAAAPRPVRRCGNYELLREIKSGGMGIVSEARDLRLNRRVALKRILPHALLAPVQRFEHTHREARAAATPTIWASSPSTRSARRTVPPSLVMVQLANGGSLQQALAAVPLPPRPWPADNLFGNWPKPCSTLMTRAFCIAT